MIARATVQTELLSLFENELNLLVPSVETDLLGAGLLDSLTFVDLLVHLERQYDTAISMEDLETENFRSVRTIAEFVISRQGRHGSYA